MKLDRAWLCADLKCQEIGTDSARCVCGCSQLISVASVMNREFPPPAPEPLRSHDVVRVNMSAARALARIKIHEHAGRKLVSQ